MTRALHNVLVTITTMSYIVHVYPVVDSFPIIIRNTTRGLSGGDATMQCIFNSSNQWLFVQWKRKHVNKDTYQTLISLVASVDDAIFSETLPRTVMQRLHPQKEKRGNNYIFYLTISNVQCSDTGYYKCEVSTSQYSVSKSTSLVVEALPTKPQINYSVLVVKLNETFKLQCTGNVGYPPGSLQWFYRAPDSDYYQLVEKQSKSTLIASSACATVAETHLNITATTMTNGGVYRCCVNSIYTSPADPKFYDEVMIKLPEFPQVTTSAGINRYVIYREKDIPESNGVRPSPSWLVLVAVCTCIFARKDLWK